MAYVVTGYWVAGYVTSDSETALIGDLQSASPSAIIELFQLDLNLAQHGINQTYYFHAGVNGLTAEIVWAGQAYQALPIEAEGFAYNGQGALPRPTVRVANLLGTVTTLLATLPDGLEGAKVTRIRTLARYLDAVNFADGNASADPLAEWPREIYYIDRKSAESRDIVEFELASVFDLAGVRAPKRQCITRCQWVYRSAECSYTGTNYFNTNDVVVSSASEDVCGKRVSSCESRFGAGNQLPYGGFPGIGAYTT